MVEGFRRGMIIDVFIKGISGKGSRLINPVMNT
jgi:hypothetical protein